MGLSNTWKDKKIGKRSLDASVRVALAHVLDRSSSPAIANGKLANLHHVDYSEPRRVKDHLR